MWADVELAFAIFGGLTFVSSVGILVGCWRLSRQRNRR